MCLNPKARECYCPSCKDEQTNISSMRNRVMLSDYFNPLVEWTLSDEWTNPLLVNVHNGMRQSGGTVECFNVFAGEISWR